MGRSRFDAAFVRDLAGRIPTQRWAGSEGQAQSVDLIEAELTSSGWIVDREVLATTGEPDDSPLAFGLAAGLSGLALELGSRFGWIRPSFYLLGAIFGGLIAVALIDRRIRTGRWGAKRVSSPLIRARRADRGLSSRVVIATHSDIRPPLASWRRRRRWTLLDLTWLAALWCPCWIFGAEEWLDRAGPALLASLGVLALLRTLDPWLHHPVPYPADNRTGLGLLVGLAKAEGSFSVDRVETEFLVADGLSPEQAERFVRDWADRPTLYVNLEAPGLGRDVVLAGSGEALVLASRAAQDLWIPWRPAGRFPVPLDHRPLAHAGLPAVTILGELDSSSIEPATLAAAAQLVTETALRWARSQGGSPAGEASVGVGGPGPSA